MYISYYQSELPALHELGKHSSEPIPMMMPLLSLVARALGMMHTLLIFITVSTLGACVPYPHSVTRNPTIEGRVLSAETGQPVANAKVELNIHSDKSWAYETASNAEGRFAFAEHRDYRLFALLADAPRCGSTLSVSAPGYRTRHCGWTSPTWCSSAPLKLPRLMLQPEHVAVSEEEAVKDYWSCIESAMEKVD